MFKNILAKLMPNKEYLAKCGHKTKLKGHYDKFGEKTELIINYEHRKDIPLCHDCMENNTIQCAWCDKPIFPGDTITLYSQANEGGMKTVFTSHPVSDKSPKEMPKHAVKYEDSENTYIGCGRTDCAESGMDYCGSLGPDGKVIRYKSAIEVMMDNPGKGVFGSHGDLKTFDLKEDNAN